MENNPEYSKLQVAALLDGQSARQISCQVGMLSRLRSLIRKYPESKEFRGDVQRVLRDSKRHENEWDKKPDWWDDSTEEHSLLLLQKLNSYGFNKFVKSDRARDGFGKADVDYDDMVDDLHLSKLAIQIKANQLVRGLDNIENHRYMVEMIEKRKRNSLSQKFDSLASCATGSFTPSKLCSGKKSTVQTGLKAFFAASTKNKTPCPNTIEDSNKGKNIPSTTMANDSSSASRKRKDSPMSSDESAQAQQSVTASPEKKMKPTLSGGSKAAEESHRKLDIHDAIVVVD